MQDDLITPVPPEENQSQPAASGNDAEPDSQAESEQIFDITDDNIAPAKETAPARYFPPEPKIINPNPRPVTSQPPVQPRPAPQNAVPANLPTSPDSTASMPSAASSSSLPPITLPPIQPAVPKPPINIPLSDFTKPLQKAAAAPTPTGPFNKPAASLPGTTINEDFFPKAADLKALRTYEGDVAEVLAHSRASTASIAIAEAKKESGEDRIQNQQETEGPSHAGKKILLAVLSLILLGAGVIGAYYLYSKSALAPSTPQAQAPQPVPSLVPVDSQDVVSVDGLSTTAALSLIKSEIAKPSPANSITEIIPIETANGQKARVSTADMLNLMQVSPPDILARSLEPSWMLGIYTDASNNKSAFVVVQTNFFQNAFAGMLQWESVMADDLKLFLPAGNVADIANVTPAAPAVTIATSTATSTQNASSTSPVMSTTTSSAQLENIPAQTNPYALEGHFEDRIIMNKDVRVFVTDSGNILFLYSFIDNTKLVVAGSEDALKEILTRLENQAFVR